jgi:hypothetical protein
MQLWFMKGPESRVGLFVAALLLSACGEETPLAPVAAPETQLAASAPQLATLPSQAEAGTTLASLRRATARYHNLDAALADGFVFLHPCEVRPGEGPVGIVYAHPERIADGVIDPSLPDALVYAPTKDGGLRLAAAELVVPRDVAEEPPTFMGATFQEEDEFGVWGLHVWLWISNPNGLFAEANPRISC